jgi:hypothetical protein
MTELEIHKAVVQQLRARADPKALWFHVPNSGQHKPQYRAKLNALGLLPGVSDLIAIHRKEIFALELKRDGGRPTELQNEFLARLRMAGGHGVVAEGFNEACDCLEHWGILRGRTV